MTLHLRDVDDVDVASTVEYAHQVLDVQHDVSTIVLRTRTHDTKVIARRGEDGTWHLRCEPANAAPYEFACPPAMPYLTLIRILEIL